MGSAYSELSGWGAMLLSQNPATRVLHLKAQIETIGEWLDRYAKLDLNDNPRYQAEGLQSLAKSLRGKCEELKQLLAEMEKD